MISRLRIATTSAIAAWAITAIVIGVHAHWYPLPHTVYNIYSDAALRWWAGQDLYVRGTDYYRYSPLFAISITPFALLPDEWGCPLWKLCGLWFYVFALAAFLRSVVPAKLTQAEWACFYLLALPLSLHSIYIGQANVVMVGSLLLGLAAAAQDRWNRAAIWLALATLIKGYPIALALLLAAHFPRRFAGRFVVALGVGMLLPFLTKPPALVVAQYQSWLSHLRDSTEIMRERLHSIDQFFRVIGRPMSPQLFFWLGIIAGAGNLVASRRFVQTVHEPKARLLRIFVLFSAWAMLFGPATECCTYIVMGPAIAWCNIECRRNRQGIRTSIMLAASFMLSGPMATDLVGHTFHTFCNDHGCQPLGALLMLAYLIETTLWPQRGTALSAKPSNTPLRPAA